MLSDRAPADLDLALDLGPSETAPRVAQSERAKAVDWSSADERRTDAGALRRIGALAIDGLILCAIDIAVIYLTMQICGLGVAEFRLLPKGTAPRVPGPPERRLPRRLHGERPDAREDDGRHRDRHVGSYDVLDLGRALKRTVAWLVLACPVGLGLLPAILSHDYRGLHDRFAGTRVVRV